VVGEERSWQGAEDEQRLATLALLKQLLSSCAPRFRGTYMTPHPACVRIFEVISAAHPAVILSGERSHMPRLLAALCICWGSTSAAAVRAETLRVAAALREREAAEFELVVVMLRGRKEPSVAAFAAALDGGAS